MSPCVALNLASDWLFSPWIKVNMAPLPFWLTFLFKLIKSSQDRSLHSKEASTQDISGNELQWTWLVYILPLVNTHFKDIYIYIKSMKMVSIYFTSHCILYIYNQWKWLGCILLLILYIYIYIYIYMYVSLRYITRSKIYPNHFHWSSYLNMSCVS